MYDCANVTRLCWTNSRNRREICLLTKRLHPERNLLQHCTFKVIGFHRTKWLISWIFLNINEPIFDERIVKIETHTHNSYANIWITTRYEYPYCSRIYIRCRAKVFSSKEDWQWKKNQTPITLRNNCVAFMFNEIRYELNDVEIHRNRNVGSVPSRITCR